jgi:hypothetical protein
MTRLLPYHQRRLLIRIAPHVTEYQAAINTPVNSRWYPLYKLLKEPCFTDYEVGELIRLKDEYEGGFSRRG